VSPLRLYEVVATWVPSGSRIADGLRRVVYEGDEAGDCDASIAFMRAAARTWHAGGAICVDVRRPSGTHGLTVQVWTPETALAEPVRQTAQGYPAHQGCGGAMLPRSVAPALVADGQLYCTTCGEGVYASAAARVQSATAAKAERRAS